MAKREFVSSQHLNKPSFCRSISWILLRLRSAKMPQLDDWNTSRELLSMERNPMAGDVDIEARSTPG